MFGKQHTLKQLSGGIAIAASLAVIAVPSASATTSSRGLITDTLGGNGSAKAFPDAFGRYVAIHAAQVQRARSTTFITDTLGGNGYPKQAGGSKPVNYVNGGMSPAVAQSNQKTFGSTIAQPYNSAAYVNGGASPTVAQAIQDAGKGLTPSSSPAVTSGGTGFSWGDAGVGAGLAVGLVLLLAAATRLRTHKRVVTA
jgi:hypothetical protein